MEHSPKAQSLQAKMGHGSFMRIVWGCGILQWHRSPNFDIKDTEDSEDC